MLTGSISLERLKAVARRNAKLLQPSGSVKVKKFTSAHAPWSETLAGLGLGTALWCRGIETIESRFIV
jgi:hypothetical protein